MFQAVSMCVSMCIEMLLWKLLECNFAIFEEKPNIIFPEKGWFIIIRQKDRQKVNSLLGRGYN